MGRILLTILLFSGCGGLKLSTIGEPSVYSNPLKASICKNNKALQIFIVKVQSKCIFQVVITVDDKLQQKAAKSVIKLQGKK